MKKSSRYFFTVTIIAVLLACSAFAQVSVTATSGTTGPTTYTTLKGAFDKINNGTHQGAISISITGNTTETDPASLSASGGSVNYTSVTISPSGGAARTISGVIAGSLITLNGADNVTIDGLNTDGNSLTLSNTSTGGTASVMYFYNGASSNTVTKCTVLGSTTNTGYGVVYFSTGGNSSNTISYCNISAAGTNRPVNAIYSLGTSGNDNSGNTISNNNIYDFLNPTTASYGINLSSYNTAWIITGNSFYETGSFVPASTAEYRVININNTGINYTVSNNYIGGSAANCGGSTAWTKTNAYDNTFYAIYFGAGTSTASNIQGNIISNFVWANSSTASWYGMYIYGGAVNIGTSNGNTIGAASGTGNITFTGGAAGAYLYGIYINTAGIVNCQNNTIASITTAASAAANATNFYGIYKINSGITTISNNTIGATATSNSIQTSSTATGIAQRLMGIYTGSSATATIANNTVANLTNSTTNTVTSTYGTVVGIVCAASAAISGNTVRNLTISNANSYNYTDYSSSYPSVCGINQGSGTGSAENNTVYNLTNNYTAFTGYVFGILTSGGTGSSAKRNFIHSLNVDASSTGARIIGLNLIGTSTISNNIISLVTSSPAIVYGIYEALYTGSQRYYYFNTVNIGGSPATGSSSSYAFYSESTRDVIQVINNIFINSRSNAGGSGSHYAVRIADYQYQGTVYLSCNYNNYYVSGTGGVLGNISSTNKTTLADCAIATTQDVCSKSADPSFDNASGTSAANYLPSNTAFSGSSSTGITVDYANASRTYNSMGAYDYAVATTGVVVTATAGTTSGSYSTLKAAFDAINAGTHQGSITIAVSGSINETAAAVLYQSGYNSTSSYTAVTMYPSAASTLIGGNLAGYPVIDLNGADNVTIDGRVNQTGETIGLTISNGSNSTSANTSAIRFINGAQTNKIRYCTVQGAYYDYNYYVGGVILFSTSTGGANSGNIIEYCSLTGLSATVRPSYVIYSAGSASPNNNSGNTIRYNNIFDFLRLSSNSDGITLKSNTTDWTISNNSFYETTTFNPTSSSGLYYTVISIANTSDGNNFTISNNSIGGSAANCGGSAWTKTTHYGTFHAMRLSVAAATASSVQGNMISNISWTNTAGYSEWYGIRVENGSVNIGTTSGNIIGAATGTDKIIVTQADSYRNFYGIHVNGTLVNVQNNIIGGITTATSDAAHGTFMYGIFSSSPGASSQISNNTVGSTTTENSFQATSLATGNQQLVVGICLSGTLGSLSSNTIANVTNKTTNTSTSTQGSVVGIYVQQYAQVITNNTIRDLKIYNANTNEFLSYLNGSFTYGSIGGIVTGYDSYSFTITGNTIYNLSNLYSGFTGYVTGLYLNAPTAGSTVSRNFVHSLSVDASSSGATISGIRIKSGSPICANNIISLGGNTATAICGIYETGASGTTDSIYFNAVYISGTPAAGTLNSYALYSNSSSSTRNIRNNIFFNARSNSGASGKHYAAYFNYASSLYLTLNNNDYYVSGTGGVLGFYNSLDVASVPLISGQDAASKNLDPGFVSAGSTTAANYTPTHTSLGGIGITSITTDYAGTSRLYNSMGAYDYQVNTVIGVTATAGTSAMYYLTMKDVFNAINAGTHQGAITISIKDNITETATATLNASGSGSASYTSVTISPSGGAARTISGSIAGALMYFNGADNVTIDGLNTDGNSLTISNTSTGSSSSTLYFYNGATSNTITKCTVLGSSTNTSGGVISFYTGGNSSNTISYCNISSAGSNRPLNAIYSYGTSVATPNSTNTISNNNIYDFFSKSTASYGINLSLYTTAWTITGNSFYETASFVPTATVEYRVINIVNATGVNFTVSNNYIGGSSASCAGTAWTKTNAYDNIFYAIYLTADTATVSNIQGNTISNFVWANSSSASWNGMYCTAAAVNIGTSSGNTIGAASGTGNITVTAGSSSAYTYGINIRSTGTVDCKNNTIASITAAGSSGSVANLFAGIYKTGNGTTTISNNTIGSTSSANSIQAASTATGNEQVVWGIFGGQSSGTQTISGNTIANLTNATTSSWGYIDGIYVGPGVTSRVTNNTVRDLSCASTKYNNSASGEAAVTGLRMNTYNVADTVTGNSIYNLSNTNSAFTGHVRGMYFFGSTTAGIISGNFIHSLSVNASTTDANIHGMYIYAGSANFSNNIISLGGNTATTINGIYHFQDPWQTGLVNLYFNTVYIGGEQPSGGTRSSYALNSQSTVTRIYKNNIFSNARSNGSGASGSHYAISLAANTNSTINYNDYYASGTGGVLGYLGSNKTTIGVWRTATSQDVNSLNTDPSFTTAGGTAATDYKTAARSIIATTISGLTVDYAGSTRSIGYPTMGAYENASSLPVELIGFSASSEKNCVTLKWKTATEINNYGFEIQRSAVSSQQSVNTWSKIGFVEGNGTVNAPKSYSFLDKSANGKTSYRLKQIDRDGKYEYSQQMEVTIAAPNVFALEQNYPNPFNPSTTINYQLPLSKHVSLIIYDAIGREVATLVNEVKEAGYYSAQFDGSALSSGIYFANLTSSGKTQMRKLLLLK